MRTSRAFTLIELLVVIVIIALLAAMVIAVTGPMQKKASMAQVVTNMKQLWTGILNYTGDHDGELPPLGDENPAWGGSNESSKDAWYNSIPLRSGGRALSSFEKKDEFYTKNNLLFVPGAKYPKNKLSKPYFAIALNNHLYPKEVRNAKESTGSVPVSVRLQSMLQPSRTIVLFESGLPDEKPMPGQGPYVGRANGWAPDIAGRYDVNESGNTTELLNSKTNVMFGDGHAETAQVKGLIAPGGGAFHPQLGGTGKDSGGTVSWTLDPETNPNGY